MYRTLVKERSKTAPVLKMQKQFGNFNYSLFILVLHSLSHLTDCLIA